MTPCYSCAQFEVVSKEDQAQGAALLETRPTRGFLHTSRPPRPAVRLSSQPYQPRARKLRPQVQDAASASGSQGYEPQPLVPVAATDEASRSPPADPGHMSEAVRGSTLQPGSQQSRMQQQQQALPSRALEAYAEQMSADLGSGLPLSPIISQQIPEWVTEAATAAQFVKDEVPQQPQSTVAQHAPVSSSSSSISATHCSARRNMGDSEMLPGDSMLPRPQPQQHITVTNPLSGLPAAAPDREHAAARPASNSMPTTSSRQGLAKPEHFPPFQLHAANPLLQGMASVTAYAAAV